ncbi:MAG TPA: hypothetical protein VF677_07340 [Flavobacterium sp.]|jgi:hypothetical protein
MQKLITFRILVLLFFFNLSTTIAQTVINNSFIVNGYSVNGAVIDLGTNATTQISFNTQVDLVSPQSNTNPGTIKVYYKKNLSFPYNLAWGGDGGNLLFSGGTSSSRNFNITLNSSDFDSSGGILYSEYQTYSGIKYKSTNISITRSNSVTPNPIGGGGNNGIYTMNIPYNAIPL